MVLMYPLHAMQINSISFFQAIGKGVTSLVLSMLRQFILYVPSAYLLTHFFALQGTWLASPLADLLAFLVTIVILSREFNRRGITLFGHKDYKPETSEVLNKLFLYNLKIWLRLSNELYFQGNYIKK